MLWSEGHRVGVLGTARVVPYGLLKPAKETLMLLRSECLLLTASLKPAPPSAQDRFAASNAGRVSEPLETPWK
jgi:hypothetical protein